VNFGEDFGLEQEQSLSFGLLGGLLGGMYIINLIRCRMIKQNIIKCMICGNSFNNYYLTGKIRNQCCSKECYFKARDKFHYEFNRKRRKRLVKEHKCIACSKKIEPVVIYHIRCEGCLEKNRK